MDDEVDFNDLFMYPQPPFDILPPFRHVARLCYVEWFTNEPPLGIEDLYNHYKKLLFGKCKKWKDVCKIALENVISIIEMKELLDAYFKAVRNILVGFPDEYVDEMAVFSFLLHVYADHPKKRCLILTHCIKDISSASLHVLFNRAEKIKAVLPPNVNFLKREKYVLPEDFPRHRFVPNIKEEKSKGETLEKLKLVDLLPMCRAANTKKSVRKAHLTTDRTDTEYYEEVCLNRNWEPHSPCQTYSPEFIRILQGNEDIFGNISEISSLLFDILTAVFHSTRNILINSDICLNKKSIVYLAIRKLFIDYEKYMLQGGMGPLLHRPKVIYLVESEDAGTRLLAILNSILCETNITSFYLFYEDIRHEESFTGDVIITTPKVLYELSGESGFSDIVKNIRLLLFDNFPSICGSLLEIVYLRIRKIVSDNDNSNLRVISFFTTLLPSTCQQLFEVCKFLNVVPEKNLFVCDTCSVSIYGVKCLQKSFHILHAVLKEVFDSFDKQVVILCQCQNSCISLARDLVQYSQSENIVFPVKQCFEEDVNNKLDFEYTYFFRYGILLLHGNVSPQIRNRILHFFRNEAVKILITTCDALQNCEIMVDTVIFYDLFCGAGVTDLNLMSALKCLDSQLTYFTPPLSHIRFIIFADNKMIEKYSDLLLNPYSNLKSQLLETLLDTICSEVCIGNLFCISHAVEWFKSTYCYITRKEMFEICDASGKKVDLTEQRIKEVLQFLEREKMINPSWDIAITPTAFTYILHSYKIGIESVSFLIQNLNGLKNANFCTVWNILCKTPALLKFKVHSCNFEYSNKSLEETFTHQNRDDENVECVENSLEQILQTYLYEKRIPENYGYLFPQLIEKAQSVADALLDVSLNMKNSVMSLCSLQLVQFLKHKVFVVDSQLLPQFDLIIQTKTLSSSAIEMAVSIVPEYSWIDEVHGQKSEVYHLWIDNDDNEILAQKTLLISKYHVENKVSIEVSTVLDYAQLTRTCNVWFGSHFWPGCVYKKPVNPQYVTLPIDQLDYTDTVRRQVSKPHVKKPDEYLKKSLEFVSLCPVVSEVLYALSATNESVLIASPCGHHRPVAAEIAIHASLKKYPAKKIIYVSAQYSEAQERFKYWMPWLNGKSVSVNVLTGDFMTDVQMFKMSNVVLATSKDFEMLTRNSEVQQSFGYQDVSLLIFDCIDVMDNYMEAGIIRLRVFYGRVIALSRFTLKNVKTIASFFKIFDTFTYNFHISSTCLQRQHKDILEDHQVIDTSNLHRNVVNNLVCQTAFENLTADTGMLIVVSSIDNVMLTAYAVIKFFKDNDFKQPALTNWEQKLVHKVADSNLKSVLHQGVGFCHPEMSTQDCFLMQELFNARNLVQVLIVTSDVTDFLVLKSEIVIIKETEYLDVYKQQYLNLPNSSLLNILAACYSSILHAGVCNRRKIFLFTSRTDGQYRSLLADGVSVESLLLNDSARFLNAEICSGKLRCTELDIYIMFSYLFRRISENPCYYFNENMNMRSELKKIFEDSLYKLEKIGCVNVSQPRDNPAQKNGMLMSTSGLGLSTMESICFGMSDNMSVEDILYALFQTDEICEQLPFRCNIEDLPQLPEEDFLPKLKVPNIPLRNRYAFYLLQAYLSHCAFHGIGYLVNQENVIKFIKRMSEAYLHIAITKRYENTALHTLQLIQMIHVGHWGEGLGRGLLILPHVNCSVVDYLVTEKQVQCLHQIIDNQSMGRLNNLLSDKLNSVQIEEILSFIQSYPRPKLKVFVNSVASHESEDSNSLTFSVSQAEEYDLRVYVKNNTEKKVIWNFMLIPETENFDFLFGKTSYSDDRVKFKFVFPNTKGDYFKLRLFMVCENYMGLDRLIQIKVYPNPETQKNHRVSSNVPRVCSSRTRDRSGE